MTLTAETMILLYYESLGLKKDFSVLLYNDKKYVVHLDTPPPPGHGHFFVSSAVTLSIFNLRFSCLFLTSPVSITKATIITSLTLVLFQGLSEDDATRLHKKQTRAALRKRREQEQQRLTVAQQIQRQLEDVEIKQREVEQRGVVIERVLRGDTSGKSV